MWNTWYILIGPYSIGHLLTEIETICVEAVWPLDRAIRYNKQNQNQLRTVAEEVIYVKCWWTDKQMDGRTDGRFTMIIGHVGRMS